MALDFGRYPITDDRGCDDKSAWFLAFEAEV